MPKNSHLAHFSVKVASMPRASHLNNDDHDDDNNYNQTTSTNDTKNTIPLLFIVINKKNGEKSWTKTGIGFCFSTRSIFLFLHPIFMKYTPAIPSRFFGSIPKRGFFLYIVMSNNDRTIRPDYGEYEGAREKKNTMSIIKP